MCNTVRPVEEWGALINAANEAITWCRASLTQIDRWREDSRRAFLSAAHPDYLWWHQMFVDGHFLTIAVGQLRGALAVGPHSDLVGRIPVPGSLDPNVAGAANDGATFVRHVRNAHEHNDDRGLFARDYGFSHRWHIVGGDGTGTVGGLELETLEPGLLAILTELTTRQSHARGHYEATLQQLPRSI